MHLTDIDQAGMNSKMSLCGEKAITEAGLHSAGACLSSREMSLRGKPPAGPTLGFGGRGYRTGDRVQGVSPTGEKWSGQYLKIHADLKCKKAFHVPDITWAQVYPQLLQISHTPPFIYCPWPEIQSCFNTQASLELMTILLP